MVYLGSGDFRRPLISKSLLRHPGDAELRASLAGAALGGVLSGLGRAAPCSVLIPRSAGRRVGVLLAGRPGFGTDCR